MYIKLYMKSLLFNYVSLLTAKMFIKSTGLKYSTSRQMIFIVQTFFSCQ